MKILDKIVKECLSQHEGGEKFFDNLDMEIQKKPIIDELLSCIKENNIIVSGKFGEFFVNYYKDKGAFIILVNGGLRKGIKINDLSYLKENIEGKDYVFVDDSFYSGKTRNNVRDEIERLGGKLKKTYVVYDGSKEVDSSIFSLYRYYKKENIDNEVEN